MISVILLGQIDGQFTDYVPLECQIIIQFILFMKVVWLQSCNERQKLTTDSKMSQDIST